jgi:hypothetical protein
MALVQCRTGGEMIDVPEGQDPHAAFDTAGCPHCADGHSLDVHCGETASACPHEHDGPCWDGTGTRPDGCTVCRPLLFHAYSMIPAAG